MCRCLGLWRRHPIETRGIDEYRNVWRRAATVVLDTDPTGTKYATRWGMRRGINIIELAYAEVSTGSWQWIARVTPAPTGGMRPPSKPLLVTQESHPDVVVPGTARFRWRGMDEGVWVPCDQGCCRLDAGDT